MRIEIDYTNHRGERRVRSIIPLEIKFGHTTYHPQSQMLLRAMDAERNVERTFAIANIHELRVHREDDGGTAMIYQALWGLSTAVPTAIKR